MTSINKMCYSGMYIGGAAIAPLSATILIASSRAIAINFIANTVLRTLTFGLVGIRIWGLSFIQLPPIMWKVSLISAGVGATIIGVSALALGVNKLFKKYIRA